MRDARESVLGLAAPPESVLGLVAPRESARTPTRPSDGDGSVNALHNRSSPRAQAAQIPTEFLAESVSPPQVAVLGLTFEAGTNDLRESPAIRLIEALRERGVCDIRVHDPTA